MPIPNPVAFQLFGLDIMWYGILIGIAILISGAIVCKRAPLHGATSNDILDILIIALPAGVICARLYYVLFNWSDYAGDLWEIINTRGGGLAIHGGLIGGFLAAYFVCRHKQLKFLSVLDLAVPAIALAQSIGRWGNYFNSEAHGGPTDLPWAITVMGEKVHPTFLYESIWCLLLFIFLIYIDNHRKFTGQVAC
ncbi:MAG: prolipoprotein diacylglyceryl transferase, partial [Anaerovoracaceae bacterium]